MKGQDERDALRRLWRRLAPWQRRWLRLQGDYAYMLTKFERVLRRIDLWLLPPLAFYAVYRLMAHAVPAHPMADIVVAATAVNAAALTVLIIRPSKKSGRT